MPEARTTHKSPSECERNILSLSPPSLPPFITHTLSFSLASFNCHMSVFHSALRFICMYVFMSFSVWVCTYSNIYQLSLFLFLFSLIHCSISFPLHHSKPSNLSLCQNSESCNDRWNEKSEGTYMYSCVHVSHIVCKTSTNS